MPKAKAIAFVCPRYPQGAAAGGAETLLRSLAVQCARDGRKVLFLTTCAVDHFTWANELPEGPEDRDGIQIIRFPVNTDRDTEAFLAVQSRLCSNIRLSEDEEDTFLKNGVRSDALMQFLHERHADFDRLVMGPYLFGLVISAATAFRDRTVLVPCLHDEPFARLKAVREMFLSVRRILFNTAEEMSLAARLYGEAPILSSGRARVVGMGLDPFEADPAAFAKKHNIGAPYILYAGRREPLKGTPMLIDYFGAYIERAKRPLALVLAGSGRVETTPASETAVLDVGFLAEQEKREAMAGAAAFVHPSANESLGIVLLEAWMAGTPALVNARSAVLAAHCRNAGAGLWFRSYPEFEEEITLLLDNPELRRAMGEAGRRYVLREYSWDAVRPRLLAALDSD